jgi:hypothetical protein
VSQDGALVEVERGIVSQVPFVCPFFYSEVGVHRVLAFRLYAVSLARKNNSPWSYLLPRALRSPPGLID